MKKHISEILKEESHRKSLSRPLFGGFYSEERMTEEEWEMERALQEAENEARSMGGGWF